MKKIFFICCFFLSFFEIKAQQYITIQYASTANVPTYTFNTVASKYVFTSTDSISKILNKYSVITFNKKYPTVNRESHPKAAKLDRTYTLRATSGTQAIFNELVNLNSTTISMFYIDSVPTDATLIIPNDYNGVLVNVPTCSPVLSLTASASLDLINAQSAWDITLGNSSVIIGIQDIGFEYRHEDLINKVLPSIPAPVLTAQNLSNYAHGTQVASIAGAETNNNKGNSSIGYKSSLKLFDYNNAPLQNPDGSITYLGFYTSMLNEAQSPNNCKIINCSFFSGCSYNQDEQDIIDIINDTYHVLIIGAAANGQYGNHCGGIGDPTYANALHYPASYNHVISVTGVNCQFNPGIIFNNGSLNSCPAMPRSYDCGTNLSFGFGWKDYFDRFIIPRSVNSCLSNYNLTCNDRVDLSSPGWWVGYAYPTYDANGNVISNYFNGSGTSFATPMVSGTAALMLAVNPNLYPEDIKAILKYTSRDIYEIWENTYYLNKLGTGRIDAGKAVQMAQTFTPGTGTAPKAPPTDIRWFEVLSNGVNTIEVESNCAANNNPGYCNIGYRLEVVAPNPSATFKWLSFYAENDVSLINNIRYGNSINLSRGVDYPFVDNTIGKLKICVRVNDFVQSIYYTEERSSSCFGTACSYTCPSDITITGNYNSALTESYTWVKSAGQTNISTGTSVKLDASPSQGFIEFKPSSGSDYMLAAPSSTGQFVVQAYNGCGLGSPSFTNNNKPNGVTDEQIVAIAKANTELYPNPTKGIFYINCNSDIKTLQVYNEQAILILEKEVNKNEKNNSPISFDLSKQPAGVYMIKSKDNKFSKRVVKL